MVIVRVGRCIHCALKVKRRIFFLLPSRGISVKNPSCLIALMSCAMAPLSMANINKIHNHNHHYYLWNFWKGKHHRDCASFLLPSSIKFNSSNEQFQKLNIFPSGVMKISSLALFFFNNYVFLKSSLLNVLLIMRQLSHCSIIIILFFHVSFLRSCGLKYFIQRSFLLQK